MNFKQLFADDEAVSPVIGVILMVAITVILAAVIGTFVLGLGDQVSNTSPTASFTFDYSEDATSNSDELQIVHDGGDQIDAAQVSVTENGATDSSASGDTVTFTSSNTWADLGGSDPVTAGSSITIGPGDFTFNDESTDGTNNLDISGATVRVTWQSSNGGDTATLGKWTGPDA